MIVTSLERRMGLRAAAILFGLAVAMELVLALALIPAWNRASGGVPIPDMRLFMGYEEARSLYDAMKSGSGEALRAFRAIELADIAFPFAYAFAFFGLISLGLRASTHAESPLRVLAALPLLGGAFDLLENALVFASIAVHPGDFRTLNGAVQAATALKFLFFVLSVLLCAASAVAVVQRWRRPRAVSTVLAPKPIGPYSQAVKVGGFLFISGQLGLDPENGELAPDARSQAERIMSNLEAILEAERLDTGDLVKTTIFLTDMADFAAVNEVYGSSFVKAFPARSTVQVAALPKGAKVEVEGIARLR